MRKFCKLPQRYVSAFTLAEMMVVMLIMSIILAAMAPVMTTRSKADSSSPWRYSPENLSDAYFGAGESQIAMIGQPNKLETDDAARLILTSSSSLPVHLSFKRDNTTLGRLQFVDTNLVLGNGSLDHLNGGSNNISIGPNNLTQVTSGISNIAIGDNAMLLTTSGNNNIGIGTTLASNVDGSYNVAVGDDSLTKANSSWNTAVGFRAYKLGTGIQNTIIGGDSMAEGDGKNNTTVGYYSLAKNTSSDANTAVGAFSQSNASSGNYNTSIGYDSLRDNDGGNYNVSVGYRSNYDDGGRFNVSSSIAIGSYSSARGYTSLALGTNSYSTGAGSIAIGGGEERYLAANSTEASSIAIGASSNASASSSIALGNSSQSSGTSSIAIGNGAKVSPKSGYSSFSDGVAIGTNAKVEGTSCGWGPCSYTAGIAIGHDAYTMSSDGIVIGNSASAECNSVSIGYNTTTERHSVAIGHEAKAIDKSVALGYEACKDVTGSNVVCIGSGSGPTYDMDKSKDHMVYLGTSSDTVYIPGNLIVGKDTLLGARAVNDGHTYAVYLKAHNKDQWSDWVYLGTEDYKGGDDNFYRTNPITVGPFTLGPSDKFTSDRRLKYVGKEFTSGLDKIRQLKVFNYTFKKDKTKTPHVGVIAQDLQKVFPDAVKKGKDGFLTIRFEDMFFAMINAIKELDTRLTALEKENQELKARIERLESKLK